MSKPPTDYLLVSDLDDTLLGDDAALRRFREYYQSIRGRVALVYASGRFCDSIEDNVQTTDLPDPVYLIGGVGSQVRSYPGGKDDREWMDRMSPGWSAGTVRAVLADDGRMTPQGEESQSSFKISYLFTGAGPDHIEELRRKLEAAGVVANLVYSSERDLDILPHNVDKAAAARYVAEKLGYAENRIITAGNSGNDAPLMEPGFNGIVVANAHHDLRERVRGTHVHQSPEPHAAGVAEGLRHWLARLEATHD